LFPAFFQPRIFSRSPGITLVKEGDPSARRQFDCSLEVSATPSEFEFRKSDA
jgi:hypothetical protein